MIEGNAADTGASGLDTRTLRHPSSLLQQRPWSTLNQMRCLCAILFGVVLAAPGTCAKKEVMDWKTGKVLDSHLAKSSVASGATTSTNSTATATGSDNTATVSGESTSSTRIDYTDIRDNQLVILGDEFADVVERIPASQAAMAFSQLPLMPSLTASTDAASSWATTCNTPKRRVRSTYLMPTKKNAS
jgi:hypothetical protein